MTGGDRGAAFGQEHELGAVVARVRAALDVAGALELVDLLGQFDIHDIETTIHTLQAIAERAADEAAGAQ